MHLHRAVLVEDAPPVFKARHVEGPLGCAGPSLASRLESHPHLAPDQPPSATGDIRGTAGWARSERRGFGLRTHDSVLEKLMSMFGMKSTSQASRALKWVTLAYFNRVLITTRPSSRKYNSNVDQCSRKISVCRESLTAHEGPVVKVKCTSGAP